MIYASEFHIIYENLSDIHDWHELNDRLWYDEFNGLAVFIYWEF